MLAGSPLMLPLESPRPTGIEVQPKQVVLTGNGQVMGQTIANSGREFKQVGSCCLHKQQKILNIA